MSGGSKEPESPHDRQCDNCGLYYQAKGPSFKMHEAACDGGSDPGASQTTDDSGASGGASNPSSASTSTGGDGTPGDVDFPDAPSTDSGGQSEPTCPECGGNEWFDASEHTEYEYGCPDCTTKDEWVVWDE